MSNVYPLPAMNYRLDQSAPASLGEAVTVIADGDPSLEFDPATNTTQVSLEDGSVSITLGPPEPEKKESEDFEENLAELLDEQQLSVIAEKLLQGIATDEQSRSAWLENMSAGLSLLGLEVKTPRGAAASGSSPAEGVSTVDHPLLLEAVLRFQANARGELLPTDGPVKIRNDGEGNALASRLADALEKDLNHYLTKVAKEYYPDTDRMLLKLGFAGIAFKKGYHDPIKRRPVIASIDVEDLIVSNATTDLEGSGRVTHRIKMRPSLLKRMQLAGAYRDVLLLQQGMVPMPDAVEAKVNEIQGIAPQTYVDTTQDQDRELYECYCEIDVPGFEHELDGELTGLPLPYRVVVDKESRKILEIRRNWHEGDNFCLPRNRIVAYIFIPGLGFYGIGLLNILGNATKAVTAAWRLMIDAGMFSNFPGFLYLKSLAKQLTNQFRVAPGTGMPIDVPGGDIRAGVMPLPYKDPSAVFIQLIENIATTAQRVGGTAELQVGEGKQDAPVGTTLAMIEQAMKMMSAVHKRLHQAQGQEFDMLRSLLMEDPEALWRHNKKSKVLAALTAEAGQQPLVDAEDQAEERQRELFLAALNDLELTPAADPNTSSQTERYLKIVALRQMAATNPKINMQEVDRRAMQTMGMDDVDSLFLPDPPPGSAPPNPEQMAAQATLMAAQARLQDAQTKSKDSAIKAQMAVTDARNKQAELASKEKIASLGVARELVIHNSDKETAQQELMLNHTNNSADRMHELAMSHLGHQHSVREATLGHQQDTGLAQMSQQFDAQQKGLDRQHGMMQKGLDLQHAHGGRVLELQHEAGLRNRELEHEAAVHTDKLGLEAGLHGQKLNHEAEQAELDRQNQLEQAEAAAKAKSTGE